MKKFFTIILCFTTIIFANNCKDWINNSDNCLNDTLMQKPKFRNTEDYMKIGDIACRTYENKYYTYLDSLTMKNGLMYKLLLPRQICREIIDIAVIGIPHTIKVSKTKIDRACCDRAWGDSYKYRQQCYHNELYGRCAQTYYKDSIIYTYAYQIQYADSARIGFNFEAKSKIELNPDYYIENNIIEIYRDNGTLKYKGELLYEPETLEKLPTYKTKGWCYNKAGTKTIRKTNNINLCK